MKIKVSKLDKDGVFYRWYDIESKKDKIHLFFKDTKEQALNTIPKLVEMAWKAGWDCEKFEVEEIEIDDNNKRAKRAEKKQWL